ncbi:MAG: hypothetical protein MUO29_05700, partial [Desulfobacterales bacterium]|nr:hypothetical protein [Desulfobacterales bacterium]
RGGFQEGSARNRIPGSLRGKKVYIRLVPTLGKVYHTRKDPFCHTGFARGAPFPPRRGEIVKGRERSNPQGERSTF